MTIQELEKEIAEKELLAEKMTDDLFPLQCQLSKYITSGKKDNEEWYGRACIAYQALKGKLRKLNKKISKLKIERKAMLKEQQKNRERIQSELFFKKLKEVLTEEQLADFLQEVEVVLATRLETEG